MTQTAFTQELFVSAIWRDQRDEAAFQTALEQCMPHELCVEAQKRITEWDYYEATPLHSLPALADQGGLAAVYCKDEGSRFGLGSFKALGGAYAVALMVDGEDKAVTVSCATEGNHGRSVAWGAQRAGVPCMIFLHEKVSAARELAIAQYGARIIRVPGSYDDAVRECARVSEENNWQIISDTTWEGYQDVPKLVMAGYSVLAQEVSEALKQPPTHVFLQAGVGGMAAALIACFSRCWQEASIRYVIVEPRDAACLQASARAGGAYRTTPGPFNTITAGLACGEPSRDVLPLIYEGSHMMLALDDHAIKYAMKQYADPIGSDPKIVSGASGAAGLAGLQTVLNTPVLREQLGLDRQSRVLLINTENDTDPQAYQAAIQS